MGFVQSHYLGVLAGLAIPIIVHLMFRRRTRTIRLGTLRFLKAVLAENARRRRLERWLLLALRLTAVALLAILFARPYQTGRGAAEQDHFVAILIDRSASMELRDEHGRLLDQAVAAAKEILQAAGEGSQVEVAFFDHAVHPLGGPIPEISGDARTPAQPRHPLAANLAAPAASFSATNYGLAMAWARDVCVTSKAGRKELHVLTDLQRSGLDWSQAEPWPESVQVQVRDLHPLQTTNVAVAAARPSGLVVRPGETVNVQVTIANHGPFPYASIPVVLRLASGERKLVLRDVVQLAAGSPATVEFEVPALAEGLWQGTVEIDVEDDLRFDNRRFLAVLASPPLRVLLVDGDPNHAAVPLSETYFLAAALRLAAPGETNPESPFLPTVFPLDGNRADGQLGLPALDATDLVLLANVRPLSAADANRLGEFVQRGGGLLVFTGENVDADSLSALRAEGLAAGDFAGTARSQDLPFRWHDWQQAHPLLEPFADPQHGDLGRLTFQAYTRIKPFRASEGVVSKLLRDGEGVGSKVVAQGRVLARFQGGDPALVELGRGRGKVLWFLSTCDRQWSNWPRSRLFVPLVHQMLSYLAGLTGGGPLRNAVIDSEGPNAAGLVPGDDLVPGVYQRQGFQEVVNPSPRESEIEHCTREEFADRFQLKLFHGEGSQRSSPGASYPAKELRADEIWHWFVFSVVGILLVESFVSNRSAT